MTKTTKKTTRKAASARAAAPITHVVVFTRNRGIYYGQTEDLHARPIRLKGLRHCYYNAQTEGNHSLAVSGPGKGSRIGPAVPESYVDDVATVSVCSPEAVERFAQAGWGK